MNERLKDTALISALSALVEDVTDLLQKELQLAKAELSERLSTKLRGGLWMAVTGAFATCAVLVLIEAVIFAIAAYGIALHWACLIVAGVLVAAAAGAYALGRADAKASITPSRTLRQVHRDVAAAREQLS